MGLLERLGLRKEQKVYIVLRGKNRSIMGVAFSEEIANNIKANAEAVHDIRTKCHIDCITGNTCY